MLGIRHMRRSILPRSDDQRLFHHQSCSVSAYIPYARCCLVCRAFSKTKIASTITSILYARRKEKWSENGRWNMRWGRRRLFPAKFANSSPPVGVHRWLLADRTACCRRPSTYEGNKTDAFGDNKSNINAISDALDSPRPICASEMAGRHFNHGSLVV